MSLCGRVQCSGCYRIQNEDLMLKYHGELHCSSCWYAHVMERQPECSGLPPCEKCAAQEAKATSAWNMWNHACHDIGRLQEACAAKDAEIARLTACMSQAGLQSFLANGTPEQVAQHMAGVAKSWIEYQAKTKAALAVADEMARQVLDETCDSADRVYFSMVHARRYLAARREKR